MGSRYMFLLLLVLLLLSTCCSSSTSISWGGCPPEERSALLRLRQELADPHDLLSSWKGLYCCSWLGIACHRVSGHVARLDLSTSFHNSFRYSQMAAVKNSSSQIFPALFQLHHLEYLDISYIDLYPLPFPSHLPMTLTKLTHLSFEGCGLTGRIPSEIGNMSTLEYLDISFNPDLEMRQSGSWIRNMRGLEVLHMYHVNVTSTGSDGALVENVASLTNLTTLWLSGVSGTTLSPLVNLTSLSDLKPYILGYPRALQLQSPWFHPFHRVSSSPPEKPFFVLQPQSQSKPLLHCASCFPTQQTSYSPFKCGRSDSQLYWEYVIIDTIQFPGQQN